MDESEKERIREKFAVQQEGDGSAVVLAHGYGCDQTMWNAIAGPLAKKHRIIRYDLAGFGAGDPEAYGDRHDDLEGHVADLIDVMEATECRDAVVVGHSVSATIGLLAAEKRPDLIGKLVLISPTPRYINDGDYEGGFTQQDIDGLLQTLQDNYIGWAGQLADLVAGEHESRATLNKRFCANDPVRSHHFAKVLFNADHREAYQKVPCPTLAIHVEKDVIAPRSAQAYLEGIMPQTTHVRIDGLGHAPHMTHAEQTLEAILGFTNRD